MSEPTTKRAADLVPGDFICRYLCTVIATERRSSSPLVSVTVESDDGEQVLTFNEWATFKVERRDGA